MSLRVKNPAPKPVRHPKIIDPTISTTGPCTSPLNETSPPVSSNRDTATASSLKIPLELKTEIDKIIQPLIDNKQAVGIAVGIIYQGQEHVLGYGETSLGSKREPNGDTLFEIGSITKVFTATLLADMADEGLVKLDDPIKVFLPGSVKAPAYGEREIKLLDLATHISGLPKVPANMYNFKNIVSLVGIFQ